MPGGTKKLSGKIVVAGTGDTQDLMRVLARRFEETHPSTVIEIPESIGSSGGIKAAGKGKIDLGRMARPA